MNKAPLVWLRAVLLSGLLGFACASGWAAEDRIVIYEKDGKQVTLPADQPLTPKIESGLVKFLEWTYQKPLSAAQKALFIQEVSRTWESDRSFYLNWLGFLIVGENAKESDQAQKLREDVKPLLAKAYKPESNLNKLISQLSGKEEGKAAPVQATAPTVNYQGTYSAAVNGGTIGLYLEQAGEKIAGRLHGLKAVYEMSGGLQPDGRMLGMAGSAMGTLYFAGQKDGKQIKLMLAEPTVDGNINQKTARLIVFSPGNLPAQAIRQQAPQAQAVQQAAKPAAQAGLASTKQCSDAHSACITACSKVGGGITGMNQCIDAKCKSAYQKCMAGRQPNVTAADRAWANQLSNTSAQIHQQQMQLYQQQIDSTNEFSRQQEERLRKERFGY